MEIFVLVYLLTYYVLPEGADVFLIKLDGPLEILLNLDSICVFDHVYLSIIRNNIGPIDKLLMILGEAPFPLSIGCVEEPIISFIDIKGDIVILLFGSLCAKICLFQYPRAPLIPNHHLEIFL